LPGREEASMEIVQFPKAALSDARIEIHGPADPVSLGIVLECLEQ
jgi:hypothetical protein